MAVVFVVIDRQNNWTLLSLTSLRRNRSDWKTNNCFCHEQHNVMNYFTTICNCECMTCKLECRDRSNWEVIFIFLFFLSHEQRNVINYIIAVFNYECMTFKLESRDRPDWETSNFICNELHNATNYIKLLWIYYM